MFKLSWGRSSDPFRITTILLPDVHSLFDAYYVVTGYGRNDGLRPVNIRATNLDGEEVDVTKGLAAATP